MYRLKKLRCPKVRTLELWFHAWVNWTSVLSWCHRIWSSQIQNRFSELDQTSVVEEKQYLHRGLKYGYGSFQSYENERASLPCMFRSWPLYCWCLYGRRIFPWLRTEIWCLWDAACIYIHIYIFIYNQTLYIYNTSMWVIPMDITRNLRNDSITCICCIHAGNSWAWHPGIPWHSRSLMRWNILLDEEMSHDTWSWLDTVQDP